MTRNQRDEKKEKIWNISSVSNTVSEIELIK